MHSCESPASDYDESKNGTQICRARPVFARESWVKKLSAEGYDGQQIQSQNIIARPACYRDRTKKK
jgi:hypothetical protein